MLFLKKAKRCFHKLKSRSLAALSHSFLWHCPSINLIFLFQLEKIDSRLSLSTPVIFIFRVCKLLAIARGSRSIRTYFEFGNMFGIERRFIWRRTNGSWNGSQSWMKSSLPLLHICGAARSCSTITLSTNSATSASYIEDVRPESAIRWKVNLAFNLNVRASYLPGNKSSLFLLPLRKQKTRNKNLPTTYSLRWFQLTFVLRISAHLEIKCGIICVSGLNRAFFTGCQSNTLYPQRMFSLISIRMRMSVVPDRGNPPTKTIGCFLSYRYPSFSFYG